MPLIGDVRLLLSERDKFKSFNEVTDFEVWDGNRWIGADEAGRLRFNVQAPAGAENWCGSHGS